ncbi:MAG: GNAT family N-acetyltransferase, partial [Actinobacteria bacterium]
MRVTDQVSAEKWDEIARQSPWSTFYHTCAWAKILEATVEGCRLAPRLFTMDDGTEVLVPGVELPACRGLLREYHSMHRGAYGGPISAVALSQDQVDEVFNALYGMASEHTGIVVIHTNPYAPVAPSSGYRLIRDCTYGIQLDGGFTTVWNERMSRNMRRGIKRARAAGIEIRVDSSDWAIEALYDLYLLSARRWGDKTTWLRPKLLCENTVKLGGDRVTVRVALLDGRPIGAS